MRQREDAGGATRNGRSESMQRDSHSLILFYVLAALTASCAVARRGDAEHRPLRDLAAVHPGRHRGHLLPARRPISSGPLQLLVYVGGTLVLVVFGVMLTAQGPFINMKISAAEWAISGRRRPARCFGVLALSRLYRTASGPERSGQEPLSSGDGHAEQPATWRAIPGVDVGHGHAAGQPVGPGERTHA